MRINGPRVIAVLAGLATFWPALAAGAPKQDETPLLAEIDSAHCLAMYDVVELRLKGRGDDVTSLTTRNGLKDFFVTRPGTVDCSGQREIPWRDDKDREFIASVITETATKAKVDVGKVYGIGPAPRPTPQRR